MFKRLGHLLLIASLLASTGGHWALLQSVAWTTMLAANLSANSLTAAVENTFDGDHPCELCKNITSGKQSEQKSDQPEPTLKKFEYVNNAPVYIFAAPTRFTILDASNLVPPSISIAPSVPPPRCRFI